jgi:hypothetical protein
LRLSLVVALREHGQLRLARKARKSRRAKTAKPAVGVIHEGGRPLKYSPDVEMVSAGAICTPLLVAGMVRPFVPEKNKLNWRVSQGAPNDGQTALLGYTFDYGVTW